MRERFYTQFPEEGEGIVQWWLSELSRLHSHILEGVEKAKQGHPKNWHVNDGLDQAKEIINHAFKDL